MPKTKKHITSYVQLCSYYGKFIHHFSDYVAPPTNTCRKNLPNNVVHIKATKAAFETLKSRIICAPILLIPQVGHEAEFGVATEASKISIVGVLLQEDTSRSLRPIAYRSRKLNDCETSYSAYDREALAVVEAISRVRRV